jgi:hypothetical protein
LDHYRIAALGLNVRARALTFHSADGRTADFKFGREDMKRSKPTAYIAFHALDQSHMSGVRQRPKAEKRDKPARLHIPGSTPSALLPPLKPYRRCTCGSCSECTTNEKWDRVFAKFEEKEREVRGVFKCALNDL